MVSNFLFSHLNTKSKGYSKLKSFTSFRFLSVQYLTIVKKESKENMLSLFSTGMQMLEGKDGKALPLDKILSCKTGNMAQIWGSSVKESGVRREKATG